MGLFGSKATLPPISSPVVAPISNPSSNTILSEQEFESQQQLMHSIQQHLSMDIICYILSFLSDFTIRFQPQELLNLVHEQHVTQKNMFIPFFYGKLPRQSDREIFLLYRRIDLSDIVFSLENPKLKPFIIEPQCCTTTVIPLGDTTLLQSFLKPIFFSMESLNLSSNHISDKILTQLFTTPCFYLKELQFVYNNCHLSTIAMAVKHCPNLTNLSIGLFEYMIDMSEFELFVVHCKNIKTLSLSRINSKFEPLYMWKLFQLLNQHCKKLTVLRLKKCYLDWESLKKGLELSTVVELDLMNSNCQDTTSNNWHLNLNAPIAAVFEMPFLEKLRLGQSNSSLLYKSFFEYCKHIRYLEINQLYNDLKWKRLGSQITHLSFVYSQRPLSIICEIISQMKQLQYLDLSHSVYFKKSDYINVNATDLFVSKSLKKLLLNGCVLSIDFVEQLLWSEESPVEELSLKHINLAELMTCFAKSSVPNSSLRKVEFRRDLNAKLKQQVIEWGQQHQLSLFFTA